MEQTQAQAPGQPQAQTPAPHRIIDEQNAVERLTKFVRDNPDNDPDHPEDSSVPRPQEAAPQVEQPAEAPTEEEFDENTPFFDLEYGGEKKKLNAKELREGWLAKQDYHRNIQKVKAQEAELTQKVQQAELQASQQAAQRLEAYKQTLIRTAAPELQNIDWNKLANDDPAEFVRASHRANQINQTLQAIEAEQRQAQMKHQQAIQAAFEQARTKARETLEADVPNWNADLYNKVLGGVAQDYGFKNQEVENVVDARLVKVFHDAYQYRQLQKAKPEVNKKVVAVPKVVKPGSADKAPASDAVQTLEKTLKKSGDFRDAARLYLARQKQK